MLTADDRHAFDLRGLLKVPGAIDVATVGRMRDAVWSFLADDRGVDRHDPTTWSAERPTGFQPLTRSGALDGVWTPVVCDVLVDLVGPTAGQRRERGRLLMTFPQECDWTVPTEGWHFDYTATATTPGPRAVQLFALLDDVHPQGGGTLVLTGSHRLVAGYIDSTGREPKPRVVRTGLATAHPWLATLWGSESATPAEDESPIPARLREVRGVHQVDGIGVEMVELTGRAGDVFVMHSDCFHAIAPNALAAPRLMCTSLVTRDQIKK